MVGEFLKPRLAGKNLKWCPKKIPHNFYKFKKNLNFEILFLLKKKKKTPKTSIKPIPENQDKQ